MSVSQSLVAFSVAAGILTITPGLDTALVLRTAAVEGRRSAIFAAAGILLGCLCWGFAASVGLGAVLAASRLAYNVLRLVGAAYLVVLGCKLLIRPRTSMESFEGPGEGGSSAGATPSPWLLRGLLSNLLNPKVGVFYVTFLPLFVPAGVPVMGFSLLLAFIHACQGVAWFTVLITATQPLTRWLRRPKVAASLDRCTGAVLVGFGLRLALDRQR